MGLGSLMPAFLVLFLQPLLSGTKLLPEDYTVSQDQHQEEPIQERTWGQKSLRSLKMEF